MKVSAVTLSSSVHIRGHCVYEGELQPPTAFQINRFKCSQVVDVFSYSFLSGLKQLSVV